MPCRYAFVQPDSTRHDQLLPPHGQFLIFVSVSFSCQGRLQCFLCDASGKSVAFTGGTRGICLTAGLLAVKLQVMRVSKMSRWDVTIGSVVTLVFAVFVSIEIPNCLFSVRHSIAVKNVSEKVILVLRTLQGSYTQALFTSLALICHHLQ